MNTSGSDSSELPKRKKLLVLWQHRALRSTVNHRHAGERCAWWHTALTFINAVGAICVLALSIVSPSPLFQPIWPWLTIGSSVLIVATSILQMLFAFGERSNAHHNTAKTYAAIERRIHECIVYEMLDMVLIQTLRQALDNASQGSPVVSPRFWGKVRRAQEIQKQVEQLEADLFTGIDK